MINCTFQQIGHTALTSTLQMYISLSIGFPNHTILDLIKRNSIPMTSVSILASSSAGSALRVYVSLALPFPLTGLINTSNLFGLSVTGIYRLNINMIGNFAYHTC